jgi:hypothetical protein
MVSYYVLSILVLSFGVYSEYSELLREWVNRHFVSCDVIVVNAVNAEILRLLLLPGKLELSLLSFVSIHGSVLV